MSNEKATTTTWQDNHSGPRRHKLMTKELADTIPPLYANDGVDDPDAVAARVKFFSPYNGWRWYVTEWDAETGLCFGLVEGFEVELGYFDLTELAEVMSNARNYVPVDREIARNYRPLRQVIDHPVRRIGDHCCILDVRSSNGVQGGVESGDSRSGAALAVRHQPARYINWYGAVARDSAQVHRGGRGGGSGPGRSCSE